MSKLFGGIHIGFLLFALTGAFGGQAGAVSGTDLDDGRHPYAGLLFKRLAAVGDRYVTCGGTLISDSASAASDLFLTASHCVADFPVGSAIEVTFAGNPGMTFDPGNATRFPDAVSPDAATVFTEQAIYKGTIYHEGAVGGAIGQAKDDYSVIRLENIVSFDQAHGGGAVRAALLPSLNLADAYLLSFPKHRRFLTMVGYGIEKWTTGGGSSATAFNGDRVKKVVTLIVNSIQPTNILEQMVLQHGDLTACNGDSGSGHIAERIGAGGADVVVGVTAEGDRWCRATNTTTRVDTAEFATFLARGKLFLGL